MAVVTFARVSKEFSLAARRRQSLKRKTLTLLHGRQQPADSRYRALHDVSFSIEPGSTVGIIGPNGAGKSTLLKLLSGIYQPTTGTVAVQGIVSPMLALGTGFCPDLSGRENIFLNASLYGYTNAAIRPLCPEIIAFAELGDWIDEPVKNYSAGMTLRLAFAVAVHLRHDILVLDEVFSVGDRHFQQKCAERMAALARAGTTIFLATHEVGLVSSFCSHALYLDGGRLLAQGAPDEVTRAYLEAAERPAPPVADDQPATPAAVAPSRRPAVRQRLLLAGSGMLLAVFLLGAAELVLRALGIPDNLANRPAHYSTTRGYQLLPFEQRRSDDWRTGYTLNELGLRDRPLAASRQSGEYRLFCLGNSCVFGTGDWLADTAPYPQQLERLLQQQLPDHVVRVVNAGVPGYSSRQGLALYREVLAAFAPDAVIIALGWNDLWQVRFSDAQQEYLRHADAVCNRSVLFSALFRRAAGPDAYFSLTGNRLLLQLPEHRVSRVSLAAFRANMQTLAGAVRADGALPVFCTLPTDATLARPGEGYFAVQPYAAYQRLPQYNAALRELAEELQVPLFDAAHLIAADDSSEALFADFVHYNERGHRIAAEHLSRFLASHSYPGLGRQRNRGAGA